MYLKLNLNSNIKVKLTQAAFKRACDAGYQATVSSVDEQEYCSFQLWAFIEIFGSGQNRLETLVLPFEIIVDSGDLRIHDLDQQIYTEFTCR